VSEHLSEPELRGFVQHTLEADRVLAVDDHLAVCGSCRERAAAIGRPRTKLAEMSADLLALEGHVSEDEIQHYLESTLASSDRARVDRHLAECDVCAREIDELKKWTLVRSRNRTLAYAAAAIAIVVLIPLGVWRELRNPDFGASLPGLEALPSDQRAAVRAALSEGVAELPPSVTEWATSSETLMGGQPRPAAAFALVAPLYTVTVSDRPEFRWRAFPEADGYTIALFDEDLNPVMDPVTLAETSWTPSELLARDRWYVWQVTARRGDESVTVPAPPAPFARFRVMDERTTALLERVSRAEPDSHLLLGILYTQAGAREEAEVQLRLVPPSNPYASVASRTLQHLQESAVGR
jgi:anti-sigma factor RsiW